jgi:hypothetical protein
MKKLILHCGLSLGDIVMLTAAVRDLHLCYPGEFVTDVRTSCADIWENNPYITRLDDKCEDVRHIDCRYYPLINEANEKPHHCLHGFVDFLNKELGLNIRLSAYRGDIHLSDQEKAWYSQVREVTRRDLPFWILAAGGKYDLTIKWWASERYQQVIDALKCKVQFVQVGACGHHHPKLDGVIDLRGQTNTRELIRLVYHAQGVLCSVTALMHLAAAVETKRKFSQIRPCVVVAGGREPVSWEHYPGHQFIHTIGALPCCLAGACWKDRTLPLRDGDERDKPENLCSNPIRDLPRCMDMITAADVVKRIQLYFDGGALRFLSNAERKAAARGIAATKASQFDDALNIHNAGHSFDQAAEAHFGVKPRWNGRGIVICGGGITYFTNAWVCINMLRRVGCTLPIEVWYLGRKEMSAQMSTLLRSLGCRMVDGLKVRKRHPARRLFGWELKPYAVLHSRFSETLLLDADNVPLLNPEFLFDCKEYKGTGAIFWPNFNDTSSNGQLPIWRSCGQRRPTEREFETGQILVDKERCWKALNLSMWLNEHSDFYYQHVQGDNETFHLAFRKARQPYFLIPHPIHAIERTMCQHDPAGRRLFQHRNMAKWDLVTNRAIKDFWFEDECLRYLTDLKLKWDGEAGRMRGRVRFKGSCRRKAPKFAAIIIGTESNQGAQQQTLIHLTKTDWNSSSVHLCNDAADASLTEWRKYLERALMEQVDFVLVLRDSLLLNRHLHHNLSHWKPVQQRTATVASLYRPSYLQERACDFENYTRWAQERQKFENEAILLSKETATSLLERAAKARHLLDLDFSRVALWLKQPFLIHAPSLVQRIAAGPGEQSGSWPAADFDRDWRAPG